MAGIPQEVHDAITEIELRSLIDSCERCECEPPCYCASNLEWAENKLAALKASTRPSKLRSPRTTTGEIA